MPVPGQVYTLVSESFAYGGNFLKYPLTLCLSFFPLTCVATRAQTNATTTYSFEQLQRGPAKGINDRGQVLLSDVSDYLLCWLYQPGEAYTGFSLYASTLPQSATVAAMNNLDQFIGGSFTGDANGRYFLYQNGIPNGNAQRDTFVSGNYASIPIAINDAGVILGSQTLTPNGPFIPILQSGSQFTTIFYPRSTATVATGLNDAGTVVGSYLDAAGKSHGFVWTNGVYSTLDVPQTKTTTFSGINNIGEIVGTYVGRAGVTRGFIYSAGTFTTINPPAAFASYGTISLIGINDEGQIAGNAGRIPFVATPSYFTGF